MRRRAGRIPGRAPGLPDRTRGADSPFGQKNNIRCRKISVDRWHDPALWCFHDDRVASLLPALHGRYRRAPAHAAGAAGQHPSRVGYGEGSPSDAEFRGSAARGLARAPADAKGNRTPPRPGLGGVFHCRWDAERGCRSTLKTERAAAGMEALLCADRSVRHWFIYLFFHSRGIAADQRTILARSSSEISTISCSTICGHSTGASARRCHRRDVGSIPTVRSNSSVDQRQIGALITLKSMVRVHPLGPVFAG